MWNLGWSRIRRAYILITGFIFTFIYVYMCWGEV